MAFGFIRKVFSFGRRRPRRARRDGGAAAARFRRTRPADAQDGGRARHAASAARPAADAGRAAEPAGNGAEPAARRAGGAQARAEPAPPEIEPAPRKSRCASPLRACPRKRRRRRRSRFRPSLPGHPSPRRWKCRPHPSRSSRKSRHSLKFRRRAPRSLLVQPRPSTGKVTVARKVEHKAAEPERTSQPAPRPSWFQRLKDGLSRSSKELSSNIAGVFTKRKLDEDTLQDLEDVLIRPISAWRRRSRVTDALSSSRYGRDVSDAEVRGHHGRARSRRCCAPVAMPLELDLSHKPHVILVVGVNGTGKTTTIGKLAAKLARRRADGDAGGRRHVPRRGDRAAEDLGRAHRRAGRRLASSAPMPRASPTTPSRRPGRQGPTC